MLIALAIAGQAQAAEESGEGGAPEPYAYAYEGSDHAAAEERTPEGKVQGYYTLKDADGRARRVEYYADESGFHANVQTNEHGTKTSNPADAQVLASPANAEQLVYYQQAPQPVRQQAVSQQVVLEAVQQPQVQQQQVQQERVTYQYQPGVAYSGINRAQYSYYPGYSTSGYTNSAYYPGSSYNYNNYAYQVPTSAYGANSGYTGYGLTNGAVYGGYNYHTPGSYYAARSSNSNVVRPVVSNSVVPATTQVLRTVTVPSVVGYSGFSGQTIPVVGTSATGTTLGSSNYSILQKRSAKENGPK